MIYEYYQFLDKITNKIVENINDFTDKERFKINKLLEWHNNSIQKHWDCFKYFIDISEKRDSEYEEEYL